MNYPSSNGSLVAHLRENVLPKKKQWNNAMEILNNPQVKTNNISKIWQCLKILEESGFLIREGHYGTTRREYRIIIINSGGRKK